MRAPTIATVINQMKGYVSKQIGYSIWQKLFNDHIIRDEYQRIWQYIDDNPAKWDEDCYHNWSLYLLFLSAPRGQIVVHIESLEMKKEEREMYVSIFERVYTARGEEKGRMEERAEIVRKMLRKGFSANDILECTSMPREELDILIKSWNMQWTIRHRNN